jgi:hypothetical protein
VALPTPELLLGDTQHATHVAARILLLRRGIEHAKILACKAAKREEKRVGGITQIRRFIVHSSQTRHNERL